MKKCKYCQSEIDAKAKVCPNCRKRIKTSPLTWVITILFIIVVVATISSGGSSSNDNEDKCFMTMQKFNQIENGMTYDEVASIIGCEGTLSTESSSGNITMKIYYWYAENGISNGTFSFTNNKLTAKSQIGLE